MKPFLFTLGMLLLFVVFLTYQSDHNRYVRQLEQLKQVADECSSSAGMYYDEALFSEGKTIYNQIECEKVIDYIIKANLCLDNNFVPISDSYWTDKVTYRVTYLDHSNTSFPYNYIDPNGRFTKTIAEPTIIVIIDAGKPPYRLTFLKPKHAIRTSAYEYWHSY